MLGSDSFPSLHPQTICNVCMFRRSVVSGKPRELAVLAYIAVAGSPDREFGWSPWLNHRVVNMRKGLNVSQSKDSFTPR